MQKQGRTLALLWVDAHADMNTPESTISGNVHGMPLAAVLGNGPVELAQVGGFSPKVDSQRCAVVGLRNLDEREKGLVRRSGVHAYTMKDIDLRGMAAVMKEALDLICADGAALHFHSTWRRRPSISLGETRSAGGSHRRLTVMEMVADSQRLVALDVVRSTRSTRNSLAILAWNSSSFARKNILSLECFRFAGRRCDENIKNLIKINAPQVLTHGAIWLPRFPRQA